MPFIISAGTFITGFGTGFQSVNVNQTPQIQRLYELGNFLPYDKNVTNQISISINKYSGQITTYDVTGNTSCIESAPIPITVIATRCDGAGVNITDDFFLQSYSYQKEVQGWGIESYTLVSRPEIIGGSGATARMIRGTAEGQTTTDGGANTGIVFAASPTVDGTTLEVTAGSPGIGQANTVSFGEVVTVGGGTGKSDGLNGNANVSIPYAPIFIPI